MDDRLINDALLGVLAHSKNLIYALDNGFLAYKGDVPESAFVAKLRQAIAIAEHLRVVADKERSADRFAVPSAANIGDGEC